MTIIGLWMSPWQKDSLWTSGHPESVTSQSTSMALPWHANLCWPGLVSQYCSQSEWGTKTLVLSEVCEEIIIFSLLINFYHSIREIICVVLSNTTKKDFVKVHTIQIRNKPKQSSKALLTPFIRYFASYLEAVATGLLAIPK